MVKEIHSQGQEINNFEGIKQVAHDFYKDLYSSRRKDPIDPTSYPFTLVCHLVQDEVNLSLTPPIQFQELKKALDHMESNKAPRPNGFTACFFKACWSIIKEDLLRMVQKSQNCFKIRGSTNSAFLALISKEKGRPTSVDSAQYPSATGATN